jgi:hypothetical protein
MDKDNEESAKRKEFSQKIQAERYDRQAVPLRKSIESVILNFEFL